jgi:endonuclease/exonuclease/phosphatase family metal-dependent hydrolase
VKVNETDGYGQYKVIYDGFDVKFFYLDTSGEYVQLGDKITLPEGSKVCVGVYSPVIKDIDNKWCTVSLRNCVLTAMDDETIDYLEGENISLVKEFTLKVATFDICKAEYGNPPYQDYTNIVAAIQASGADIIGLQAVDYRTGRSGGIDQARAIADAVGYYCWTFPAFDFDGGKFGVAIISKYPILGNDITYLPSGKGEQRILARAGMIVDNEVINFFVTAFSYNGEPGTDRAPQFAEVAEKIAEFDNVILMGSFNTDNWQEFEPIVDKGFSLVNNSDAPIGTYNNQAFDNIVHSEIFTSSGGRVVESTASDHYLLYTTLTYDEATLTDDE